jgi:Fe2+ transport system protein FeoA
MTLLEVPPGSRAQVVDINGLSAVQVENLQAFGLVKGHWLQVLQHAPVTVIQIGNTELALEADLARQVEVEQQIDSSKNGTRPRTKP